MMWPLKAAIFSLIFTCSPIPVAKATSIIITPIAIAAIAIFIIGADMLLLYFLVLISLLAIKNSKFKVEAMVYKFLKNTFLLFLITTLSCGRGTSQSEVKETAKSSSEYAVALSSEEEIKVGANRLESYLPLLEGKKVGLVGNQSSVIFRSKETGDYIHVVDSLLSRNVDLVKVFAPEHGFRGTADAGEAIKDGKDSSTGLPVISLYGDNKKPTTAQLKGLDMLIFDLQDV